MPKDLSETLRRVTGQTYYEAMSSHEPKTLPQAKAPAPIPERSGSAVSKPASSTGSIASPLKESSFAAREYHPGGYKSSDGIFFMPAIKKVVLADANGSEVVFNFAAPPA